MIIRSASVTSLLFLFCGRDSPDDGIFTAYAQKWNNRCGNQHVGSSPLRDLQGYRESCRQRRIHFSIVGLRYLRCGIIVDISCGSETAIDRNSPEQIRHCTWGASSLQVGSRGRNWTASWRLRLSIGNDSCDTK